MTLSFMDEFNFSQTYATPQTEECTKCSKLNTENTELKNLLATMKQQAAKTGEALKKFNAVLKGSQAQKQKIEMLERREEQRAGELQMVRSQLKRALDNPGEDYQRKIKHLESELANERSAGGHVNRQVDTLQKQTETLDEERKGLLKEKATLKKKLEYLTVKCNKAEKAAKQAPSSTGASAKSSAGGDEGVKLGDLKKEIGALKRENSRLQNFNETKINDLADRKNKDITARLTSMESMMQSMMESMRDNGVTTRSLPKMSPSGKRMGRPSKRRLPSPEPREAMEEPSTPPPRFKKPVTRPLMKETALTDDSASDSELASQLESSLNDVLICDPILKTPPRKKKGRPSTRAASQAAVQAMAVAISARKSKEAASTATGNFPAPSATVTEKVSNSPSSQPSSSRQSTSFQFPTKPDNTIPTSAIFDLFLSLPIITPLEAPATVGESSSVSESPIIPRAAQPDTPVKPELNNAPVAASVAVKSEPAVEPAASNNTAQKPSFTPVRFVKASSAVQPVVSVKPAADVNIVKPVEIVKPALDEPAAEPGTPLKNEPVPDELPVVSLEPVGTPVKGEGFEPAVMVKPIITVEVEEKPLTKLEPLPMVSDPVLTTVSSSEPVHHLFVPDATPTMPSQAVTPDPVTIVTKPESIANPIPVTTPSPIPETPPTLVTKPESIAITKPLLATPPQDPSVPVPELPVTPTSPVPVPITPNSPVPVPETIPTVRPSPVSKTPPTSTAPPVTPTKEEAASSNGPTKEEPIPFGSPDCQPILIKNRRVRSTQPVLTLPPIIINPLKKEEKVEGDEGDEISVICDLSKPTGDQVSKAPLETSDQVLTAPLKTSPKTPENEIEDAIVESRPVTPPPAFHASFSDTIVTATDMQCAFEVDVISTASERKLKRVQKMLNSEGKGASPTKRLRRRTISLSEPGLKKRRTASIDKKSGVVKKKGSKKEQVNGVVLEPVVNILNSISHKQVLTEATVAHVLESSPVLEVHPNPVAPEVPGVTEDLLIDDVPLAIVCGDDEPSTIVDTPPVEEPSRKRKKSTAPIVETIFDLFIPLPPITKPDLNTTTAAPATPAPPLNSIPLQPSVVTTPDGLQFLPGYEDYKNVRCDKKVGQLITEMFRRNMYDSDPDLGYLYRTLVYNIQHRHIIQPDVKFCAVIRNEIIIRNGMETAQAPPPVSVLVEFFHSLLIKISEACPGFGDSVLKQLFMKLTKSGINFDNRIPTMFQFCIQLSTAMSSYEDLRAHVIRVILRKTVRNSYQLISQLNQITTDVMLGVGSPKMNRKDNLLHLLGLEFFLRYGKVRYNPAASQWANVHQFTVEHRLIERAITAITTKGEENCSTDEQGLLCLRLMAKSQTWDWVIGTLLPEMFKVLESTTEYGVSRLLSAISHLIVSEITDNRADLTVIKDRLVPCIIDIASSGPTEDVKMAAIRCLVDIYPLSPESIRPVLQLWYSGRNTSRQTISDKDSFRNLEKSVLKVLSN